MKKRQNLEKVKPSLKAKVFGWLFVFFGIAGFCGIVVQVLLLCSEFSRSSKLPTAGDVASIVASGLAVLAALAAYFRFFSQRSWAGRLEFTHTAKRLDMADPKSPWLITLRVKNTGSRDVTIKNVLLFIRQIPLEDVSNETAKKHENGVPALSLSGRFGSSSADIENGFVDDIIIDSSETVEFCFRVEPPAEDHPNFCEVRLVGANYEWYVPFHLPSE